MKQFVGTSLKTRLYLMVLVAFVPITLLILFVAEEQKRIETRAVLEKTLVLARTVAAEESQQFETTRNLLFLISDAFLSAGGDTDRLSRLLANLLHQSKGYAAFGVLDLDGRPIVGSAPTAPDQHPGRSAWFQACIQNKKLTLGSYHGEHIDGEPVLYFALPVEKDGSRIEGIAFAALKLQYLNRTLFGWLEELPKGSRLTFIDGQKGALRYGGLVDQWTAVLPPYPPSFSTIVDRQVGTLSASDGNGLPRIYAFAPMDSPFRTQRITVVLDVPRNLALATSRRSFVRNLTLLLASALLALLFIWWAGETLILKRIRNMVYATRQLASGDLDARIGRIGSRDELSHLASVFDEMAESLKDRIDREKRVMASLEYSQAQLRRLGAYQNEVREQERIRIAREIHDQLGQSLTVLQMDLSWLKKQLPAPPSAIGRKLNAMSDVIVQSLEDLHAVMAELRPVILDDFGLAAAIEWQIEEFNRRTGIACRIVSPFCEPELPKNQATAVFRVFQEALTNVLRHARADTVWVRLAIADGDLVLDIRDNGRGITDQEINAPDAYGLLGIRERLLPWNGCVSFQGRPGEGTRVTVRLPIAEKGNPP